MSNSANNAHCSRKKHLRSPIRTQELDWPAANAGKKTDFIRADKQLKHTGELRSLIEQGERSRNAKKQTGVSRRKRERESNLEEVRLPFNLDFSESPDCGGAREQGKQVAAVDWAIRSSDQLIRSSNCLRFGLLRNSKSVWFENCRRTIKNKSQKKTELG